MRNPSTLDRSYNQLFGFFCEIILSPGTSDEFLRELNLLPLLDTVLPLFPFLTSLCGRR